MLCRLSGHVPTVKRDYEERASEPIVIRSSGSLRERPGFGELR